MPSNSPLANIQLANQAAKLSHIIQNEDGLTAGYVAVCAEWIPQDPIIATADGDRLPCVPLVEAANPNAPSKEIGVYGTKEETRNSHGSAVLKGKEDPLINRISQRKKRPHSDPIQRSAEGSLRRSMPPSRTSPLFPPLPLYGPPTLLRNLQCMTFRASSFCLSLAFLGAVMLGSALAGIPLIFRHMWLHFTFRNPDARRPFYEEEQRRKMVREEAEKAWKKRSRRDNETRTIDHEYEVGENDGFIPTEGGPDPLVCDVGYYARRVGLDVEEFKVQTEDGFIIALWHVYNPAEFIPRTDKERQIQSSGVLTRAHSVRQQDFKSVKPKYPVLMIHGLLQSAGAYCTNDDSSLAFYLCKAGYDVWLGNNRCGFTPEHMLLSYSDPRMWAWNIRQMGVIDLPALVSRVLTETGFEKLGLICHSQGTTETFVALAKEQRPELGDKISVFCALAPAVYAGPLIGKIYFKFMRAIPPALFRIIFGIHAFIPFMMTMHSMLPGRLYGALGYRVFGFLFDWSDERWDRGLRDRHFQFAPVYISSESMRWWLGRECFAKQKCILATREEARQEEVEDEEYYKATSENPPPSQPESRQRLEAAEKHRRHPRGSTAWYDERCPPMALWICGSDDLVDGRRLLRRFERGREPYVRLVHAKIVAGYQHLDVIWAIDVIEQVGCEINEVLWKTCSARARCRVPRGCEAVGEWRTEGIGEVEGRGGEADESLGERSQSSSTDEKDVGKMQMQMEIDSEAVLGLGPVWRKIGRDM